MSLTSVRNFLISFFNPDIAASILVDEIKEQRNRIKNLKEEYKSLSKWNHQYVSTLSLLTEAMEALIWKKDKNHKYILANPLHCKTFFGYDKAYDCLDSIVGKTDNELIELNFEQLGIQNTFGKVCLISDTFTMLNKGASHFLEAGMVDGKEFLFYSVKTSQFTSKNEFVGSIGMAWDLTNQSDFLISQLNRWIYAKKVTKLFHKKDVFCYAITPEIRKCSVFHHLCPDPERGKVCDDNCSSYFD